MMRWGQQATWAPKAGRDNLRKGDVLMVSAEHDNNLIHILFPAAASIVLWYNCAVGRVGIQSSL
jgi:hypothetical protein